MHYFIGRAAPRTGRLRCCSSLPWSHHDALLRLAFGRFSGLPQWFKREGRLALLHRSKRGPPFPSRCA